ncbi:MAG: haloacid dehalogenase-like hydrolase [Thermoleophilia bacterium]
MLALVDIDGTLLRGTPRAHTAALVSGMREVFGVWAEFDDVVAVGPAGRTDREIARLVLRRHGVADAEITEGMDRWMERAVAAYPALDAALPGPEVLPGAAAGLARMADAGVALALLTGNLEPIARAKMARAGLGERFPPGGGGYGSDHERRGALVALAVDRACGDPRARRPVVVGDTPRDIACAREGGARCIAVTTGVHGADALAGADAVVDGLEGAAAVIEGWLAGG